MVAPPLYLKVKPWLIVVFGAPQIVMERLRVGHSRRGGSLGVTVVDAGMNHWHIQDQSSGDP